MRQDPDGRVRLAVCHMLGMIGRGAKDVAPQLVEVMKESKDEKMRQTAAGSLWRVVGPDSKNIVPGLLQIYKNEKDESRGIKSNLLISMAIIGDKEEILIPLLVRVLQDPKNLKLRATGAAGLGYFGPKSKEAVPALIAALDVSAFKDAGEAFLTQSSVLEALGKIGPAAKAAIPAVRKIALDPGINLSIRLAAEKTFELIQK